MLTDVEVNDLTTRDLNEKIILLPYNLFRHRNLEFSACRGNLLFILDNLADPITNSDVAAVTGLHKNYALSLFTQTMRILCAQMSIK
jgi:hypothetical protein